ncbi:MAG: dephospho-CoA kinase [Bryobacteraceae bacterium]|jgi:dephospho-CoA kinase
MLTIGLTGGLASGKSFVSGALARLGCHVLRADAVGHEVLEPGGEAYHPVIAEFGREILNDDGAIDRRRLAAIVFSAPERLAKLNSLVHPAVFRREDEFIREIRAAHPEAIVVVEAAILVETGSYRKFDRLAVTVCDRETQIRRAMKRDRLTLPEVETRLSRQLPADQLRKVADYVIDTSGTKENTLAQVQELHRALRSLRQ